MHDARYYYDIWMNYENDARESGLRYQGFDMDGIFLRDPNHKKTLYLLMKDGKVIKEIIGRKTREYLTLDELKGDTYELYSDIIVYKSGYLTLDKKPKMTMNTILKKLYNRIYSKPLDTPVSGAVTEYFSYMAKNDIMVSVMTVQGLCDENRSRVYYGAKIFPFIKELDRDTSLYAIFYDYISDTKAENTYQRCNDAIEELQGFLKDAQGNSEWKGCKLKYPIPF